METLIFTAGRLKSRPKPAPHRKRSAAAFPRPARGTAGTYKYSGNTNRRINPDLSSDFYCHPLLFVSLFLGWPERLGTAIVPSGSLSIEAADPGAEEFRIAPVPKLGLQLLAEQVGGLLG